MAESKRGRMVGAWAALAPMLAMIVALLSALMLMEALLPGRLTATGPTEAIAAQTSGSVGVPLASIEAVVPPGFAPGNVDSTVRVGQPGHPTAVVSDLNAAGHMGRSDARDVQAVAVLIVVGAGMAAIVGAFVLRRRLHGDRP